MNMKKTALSTSILLAMGGAVSQSANASLVVGTTLNIGAGSFFTMEPTPVGPVTVNILGGLHGGVRIGVAQGAAGGHPSHGGAAHTSKGRIDQEWDFFGAAGQSITTTGPTVVTDSGATKTLDFSGWAVAWNGIPNINMGGGIQDCGTSTDGICVTNAGADIGGTFDNGTGLATITCSVASCSNSSTYTLSYSANVPQADSSNFGGVLYSLELTGHITAPTSAVPVPAAVWLFGSGLLGLVGVARRKKA